LRKSVKKKVESAHRKMTLLSNEKGTVGMQNRHTFTTIEFLGPCLGSSILLSTVTKMLISKQAKSILNLCSFPEWRSFLRQRS